MRITGERIVTREGGFNPTWQRHAANYRFASELLGTAGPAEPVPAVSPVLDLGCGNGHASHHLGERWSVGVDRDHDALAAQARPGVRADLRHLPFPSGAFASVVCLHAVEHVADPDRVVAECARVVSPEGAVVFATPNRLTFGRPDEVIDPYHFVEFSPDQLQALVAAVFAEVTVYGVFGSARYMDFFSQERRRLDRLLAMDPLRLRRFVPRSVRQRLYDWRLTKERAGAPSAAAVAIDIDDFSLRDHDLDGSLDLIARCRRRR
ncbi:MAG TPA: class I SAM-dependent methyltransferase [Acidimicrobiales bacterium]|nr:class I SAM-dependent methyltransferase [Acidimicrobiales bacterium]